jgi:integrase
MIDSASNLFHRAMLITMYSTGMRRAELCNLKVEDIDSTRMIIHIRQGKRGKDRDVPLSPKVLETLREYWRWMKPKTYLFPGTIQGIRADKPITHKVLWEACKEAAERAGITKAVRPHLLRHYSAFRTMPRVDVKDLFTVFSARDARHISALCLALWEGDKTALHFFNYDRTSPPGTFERVSRCVCNRTGRRGLRTPLNQRTDRRNRRSQPMA